VGTTGLSVEPGGQRADGKARISSVQTVGTSICAGEEGLALEAVLIGGHLIRCDLQLCERFAQWSAVIAQDQYAYQLCAPGAGVAGFC